MSTENINTSWSLDSIYPSYNCEEFKKDSEAFRAKVAELNSWADNSLTGSKAGHPERLIYEYLVLKNKLMYYEKIGLYLNLAVSVDTGNTALGDLLEDYEAVCADIAHHEALFSAYLKRVNNLEELIKKNMLLKEHGFFLRAQRAKAEHILSPEKEVLISKMKANGSTLWAKQWEQLTSSMEIEFEYKGKARKEPLSAVRNMAYSEDGGLRKAAYEAELKAYKNVELPASFSLNGIKGEVIALSKMRGYKSPLAMTLEDSHMDKDVLVAMLTAVSESLPELCKYFKAKAEYMGYEGKLPFYELFAPLGEEEACSLESAKEQVISAFYSFSDKMGDFAKNAFDNRWIDLMPRKGKVGGAFSEAIHPVKESRILTNFGGTFSDAVTLAHELGHSYHDSRLYSASPINSSYPLPIAETASTFCEALLIEKALERAEGEKRLNILENDLSGIMQTLADIYSRFLFEHRVFEARKTGSLSPEMLCGMMVDAQKEAYCGSLDENYLHPYMWVCKPHYYDGDFNYYNYPYAFGMLLSKALYGRYKIIRERFVGLYDTVLSASGSNSLVDLGKIAGIDLKNKAFWEQGIDLVKEEIEEYILLTQKKR